MLGILPTRTGLRVGAADYGIKHMLSAVYISMGRAVIKPTLQGVVGMKEAGTWGDQTCRRHVSLPVGSQANFY